MTEQEAQVMVARLTRIWGANSKVAFRHANAGWTEISFVTKDYLELLCMTDSRLVTGQRLLALMLSGYSRDGSCMGTIALLNARPMNTDTAYEEDGECWVSWGPSLLEHRETFRRNCWLSGFTIEASAHEKAEWIQGFTKKEIVAWNLKI